MPLLSDDEVSLLPNKLQLRIIAWLRFTGQFDRTARLLAQLEQVAGASAALLDEQAMLALARGDTAAVRDTWDRRLSEFPAPSARAAFARALLELGEIEEAAAIADDLSAESGELATVRALAAEVALQCGDVATARAYWLAQLGDEIPRISPLLAIARIDLLHGDRAEARTTLSRAFTDVAVLTPAQLATAASLAELLGQPARAHMLRVRYAHLEVARTAALAAEIDEILGRAPSSTENGHLDIQTAQPGASSPIVERAPSPEHAAPLAEEELVSDPRVLPTLRETFGYETLLPGQAAVINRVLSGRDSLAILPTGAGKSLTFQLSSMLLSGTTLVLSPLIALMKDQIEGLPAGLGQRSVLVNSSLSPAEQERALELIAKGDLKLVYAAPERLRQPRFLRALREAGVSLVVVDEAHCISLWGHDFRPDYLSIPTALPELGTPPLLAMTATASVETAASIASAFKRDLDVVRVSSFRPNLFYAAEKYGAKEEKARRVVALCRELEGQGIVYVSSRREADNLAGVLCDNGVPAVAYHAGMEPGLRAANQDRFMRGAARVIVATVAFGMGVNKPDVRFIIHFSPPTSLEAYAQESGRAGRDGLTSRCVLLYTAADRANQTRLAQRDAMDLDTLRQVYAGIKRNAAGAWAIFDPSRIVLSSDPAADPDDLPDPRIGIGLLEQGNLLERHPNAPVAWTLSATRNENRQPAVLSAEDAATWLRLVSWAGLDAPSGSRVTLRTAEACDALDVTPEVLARILDGQGAWSLVEGARLPCLRLLPAGTDAGSRLQRVIDAAAGRARARVDRIMTYAAGRRCRHVEIAAHLGERLDPCGNACDVCTGESEIVSATRTRREPRVKKRATATAADATVVLQALVTAPFPVGKTGLTRLLEGSIQSRIQGDRSRFFGALTDLQKSKIEAMIDGLVEDHMLVYDRSREFPVLRLTDQGKQRLQREHDDS